MHNITPVSLYFGLLSRIFIPAIFLVLFLGCANVKVAMRDANATLTEVMTYTEFVDDRVEERLFTFEERILDTCHILFTITDFALLGEKIPFLTQLKALFS